MRSICSYKREVYLLIAFFCIFFSTAFAEDSKGFYPSGALHNWAFLSTVTNNDHLAATSYLLINKGTHLTVLPLASKITFSRVQSSPAILISKGAYTSFALNITSNYKIDIPSNKAFDRYKIVLGSENVKSISPTNYIADLLKANIDKVETQQVEIVKLKQGKEKIFVSYYNRANIYSTELIIY